MDSITTATPRRMLTVSRHIPDQLCYTEKVYYMQSVYIGRKMSTVGTTNAANLRLHPKSNNIKGSKTQHQLS